MIIIEIQHANPYYDDSYAVNSENLGPYGDAITYELIPYLEKKYRCLGTGWSRFLYGGSTGGWEALAAQIFYPDEYNGCFAACPDPIDFRAYTVVNIYKDKNAYYDEGPWHKVARPGMRNYLGHVSITVEDINRHELVLGTKSRSGQQWDIWEAVYSPVGPDGYPKRIWDKQHRRHRPRGRRVLARALRPPHILERDWPKIGKKLEGKIHIYVGDMDNYYLNNAVYLDGGLPQEDQGPGLRRRGRLRRPGRALLERRPHPAQRHQPAPLSSDVRAQDRRAAPEDGPAGGRRQELAILSRVGESTDAEAEHTRRRERSRCGIPSRWDRHSHRAGLAVCWRPADRPRRPSRRRRRCPSGSAVVDITPDYPIRMMGYEQPQDGVGGDRQPAQGPGAGDRRR